MKLIHAAGPDRQPCDPYRELAVALIKQAVDDYRHLARKNDVSGSELERKRIRQQMTSISRFFLGDCWFCDVFHFVEGQNTDLDYGKRHRKYAMNIHSCLNLQSAV